LIAFYEAAAWKIAGLLYAEIRMNTQSENPEPGAY
jgi:hypothetical protein